MLAFVGILFLKCAILVITRCACSQKSCTSANLFLRGSVAFLKDPLELSLPAKKVSDEKLRGVIARFGEALSKGLDAEIKKSAEDLQRQLGKIRSGRASANLLDDIKADNYGVMTPLRGMATISVPEPRLIIIQPFDPGSLKGIEKALQASDLGLHPQNDGKVLRINIPDLTEERRKELVKVVHTRAEEHRVTIRQFRKDANAKLKDLEKGKTLTADDLRRDQDKVQKATDAGIKKLDEIAAAKEKEILAV